MECVKRCEFQDFDGENFHCEIYDDELEIQRNLSVEDEGKIMVLRCKECIEEGLIGSNTKGEFIRKTKQHLGLLMDSFYSFKDDIEDEATHIYRLLKEVENEDVLVDEDTDL
jgi:hypothetical protein